MTNLTDLDNDKASKEQTAGTRLNDPADGGQPANLSDQRQIAMKHLLETDSLSVDDKLATVKAVRRVHEDRFQSAFRSLMGTSKS